MPIDDNLKCQTYVNVIAEIVQALKEQADRLDLYRAAFIEQTPDVTGTPLEGNTAALNVWRGNVRDVADNATANAMIAEVVPTHMNQALGEVE